MHGKYIIIGGGIAGASTAYYLAKAGNPVTIIDRKDEGQATDAAAGIICPWLSQRRNKAWYHLAKNGARIYPELIKDLAQDGEQDTGYTQVGAISLHTDEKKLIAMKERGLKRREDAPEIGEINLLTPDQTRALFPLLGEEFGSVHVSGAARVDGRKLRDSLLRGSQKHGATCIMGDASLNCENKKVIGVTVNGEDLSAETVIAANGAWMSKLIAPLGVTFNVKPQRAQIMHLKVEQENTGNWPVVMPPTNQYMLAFEDQRIVVGATHEDDTGFDYQVTAGGLHEILTKAIDIAPALHNAAVIETRVGFRPVAPGFLPILGPLPGYEGILLTNGCGASGLTMGPYIGSQLAKLAQNEELDIDLANYDVGGAIG
ncbi:FAD-binding oxidoreductase [Virgibacillus sp. SK37]|uniref:NAD(P)/FAD-dependent oxidoreductase n=1 Tax=Virgibacillus sp. SK37 TaxID=403957 RepID=UPI0004D1205F|nr:FAD-binding oxidoreductase [Virgibacillus sp. SK37]AIF42567.1 oxidoreductase [Virgibacillus sp. SK37]